MTSMAKGVNSSLWWLLFLFSSKRGRRREKVINFPSVQRERNLTAEKMSDFWGENKKKVKEPFHAMVQACSKKWQKIAENSRGKNNRSKWLQGKNLVGVKLKDMATDLVCHWKMLSLVDYECKLKCKKQNRTKNTTLYRTSDLENRC